MFLFNNGNPKYTDIKILAIKRVDIPSEDVQLSFSKFFCLEANKIN